MVKDRLLSYPAIAETRQFLFDRGWRKQGCKEAIHKHIMEVKKNGLQKGKKLWTKRIEN